MIRTHRRLTAAALALALVVVSLGAWVRLSDAGLGCPDWPGCYGHLVGVPDQAHEIAAAQAAFPGKPVEAPKAWKEMIHRYAAGGLGLVIAALAVLAHEGAALSPEARADLDAFVSQVATKRTARAWLYKEQLREILERKQVNVVRGMLTQWATNVIRSKVEPMKVVAKMIRSHLDGIVAWTQTRQTNGFLEALNGLFQSAKRRARGFTRFTTIRTVIFLIAGKLDFAVINPHARQPT